MRTPSVNFGSAWLHLFVIAAFSCIIYSNTFSVPFHFDDKLNIVDNAFIKDMNNFWPPAGTRWFGFLTFALNYRLNGLDTAGYHAVNLAVHILNSFLVYWLVLLTFKTPYFLSVQTDELQGTSSRLTAFLAGLLFAVHPVQTQAVTYIVQRLASLAALLYLLSITLYVRARLTTVGGDCRGAETNGSAARWLLYAASLLSAVLAMKTKETAVTLPAVIILYELGFFRGTAAQAGRAPLAKGTFYLLPFLLISLLIPLSMMQSGSGLNKLLSAFSATNEITRHDYLLTQFRVIITYLRLLFFPVNQSVDYDFTLYRSFFDAPVLLSFLFLAFLCAAAVFLYRSRASFPSGRVAAFGLFWFFITLSVESSIVPIADLIFEHRIYLPGVGIFITVAMALTAAACAVRQRGRRALGMLTAALAVVIIVLSAAAFMRNRVWGSETGLWEDAVKKQPGNVRAHNMLGILYNRQGRPDKAIEHFFTAVTLRPSYAEAHVNLGGMYVEQGMPERGMKEFMTALELRSLDAIDTANLYIQIGYCYLKQGLPDRAIEFYNYALPVIPDDANVYLFLARAYEARGMGQKAEEYLGKARQLNPDRF